MPDAMSQQNVRLDPAPAFAGFLETHRGLVLCVIATVIVAAPLAFIRFAPLHDYPFHLARMAILRDLASGGELSRYYEFGSFLIPNVGMDVIVLALSQVLPVETAAAAFVGLTLFVSISGAAYLQRSLFRSNDFTPFIAALLTYNSIFTLGFLNYLFGIGLMLWCVAFFIRLRGRSPLVRFGWGCLAGLALLFAHLAAFGLYTVIVAGLELQANWMLLRRAPLTAAVRLVLSALPLLLIVGLFYALSPTAGQTSSLISFEASSVFEFLRNKFWLLRQTLAGHENVRLDLADTALAVVMVVLACIFAKPHLAKLNLASAAPTPEIKQ